METFSGSGLLELSWKMAVKQCCVVMLVERLHTGHGRNHQILVVIQITLRYVGAPQKCQPGTMKIRETGLQKREEKGGI